MKIDKLNLKPCPYCGGKPEYKTKKKKFRVTIGASGIGQTQERFIRCSKCHARTQAYGKIDNVINAWEAWLIYDR